MAKNKFLDTTGLSYFWSKIKPMLDAKVPASRKVNEKELTEDITLTAEDVGAIASTSAGAAGGVATLDENGKIQAEQIPDELSGNAADVTYDNTTSGLTATDVQAAIDELANEPSVPEGIIYMDLESAGTSIENIYNNADSLGGESAEEWQKKIDDVVDGTTVVAEATKATFDGDGNEIGDTYLLKTDTAVDSAMLGGKDASEYVSVADAIGSTKVSVGVENNKSLDMLYFEFSDGTKKLLKYDNETGRVSIRDFDGTYWDGVNFATTADLANYLNLGGGTVANHALLSLSVRNTGDNGVVIGYYGIDDILGSIGFNDANNPAFIPQDGSRWYKFFHEGNKPTGSYTGNGSAEVRTINIGGTGRVLFVECQHAGYGAIVWDCGAIVFGFNTVEHLTVAQATFYNGVLTLATDHAALNMNGQSIYYQVL